METLCRASGSNSFCLAPGDLLVFYAGLTPRPPEDRPQLFVFRSSETEQQISVVVQRTAVIVPPVLLDPPQVVVSLLRSEQRAGKGDIQSAQEDSKHRHNNPM